MKKNIFLLFLLTTYSSILTFAQDKKVDVDLSINKGTSSTTTTTTWYTQPWVWVVGAAVFILLLVAILKSGRKD